MLTRFFVCFSLLLTCSSFLPKENDNVVEKGNVIYSFESGKMQCQSQKDADGNIVILLKSLDKNTTVQFNSIVNTRNGLLLKCMMIVNEETDLCASWTNVQEVSIVVDPIIVQNITLFGKSIYQLNKITIVE